MKFSLLKYLKSQKSPLMQVKGSWHGQPSTIGTVRLVGPRQPAPSGFRHPVSRGQGGQPATFDC